MAARYGYLINKWVALGVLTLAVMAALLATTMPVSAQTSPIIEKLVPYVENGKQAVDTFDATGLEAGKVFWYLEGTDAGDFKLGSFAGRTTTLLFRSSPNYEDPQDAAQGANPDLTPPLEADAVENNRYQVTVRAGDGGANKSKIFRVTVEVTNAKEDGKMTLTPIQPQVTRQMTARLSDPDRVNPDALNWSWTSSATMNGSYTPIPGALNQNTYTPRTTDVDRFIRVKATYRDGATRGEETAMAEETSDHMVEAQPFPNVAPVFADQMPANGTTGTDDDLETTRVVAEGLPADTLVGPPVTAVDHDGDVLTYTIVDDDTASPDRAHFDIDPKTGQITTNKRFDADGDSPTCTNNSCQVTVTATDPSGLATAAPLLSGPAGATRTTDTNVEVTINIAAEHEAPNSITTSTTAFDPGDVAPTPPTNTHEYQDRAERVEAADSPTGTASGTEGGATGTVLATYTTGTPEDPDGTDLGGVTWRVAGPDGSEFIINDDGELRFDDDPNYDDPADENEDNVYELIVVASDPQLNVRTLWVTIKVTDVQENGKVSFNKRHPAVGEPITAELEDPDGVSSTVDWEWHKDNAATPTATFTPSDATKISGAESATYTPTTADEDNFLKAVATYNDKQTTTEQMAGGAAGTIANTSNATTLAVLAVPPTDTPNTDPIFDPDHTTARKYYVAENAGNEPVKTVAGGTDAVPVAQLTAGDTAGQTLTYSLSGPDAKYFKIGGSLDDPDLAEGTLQTDDGLDFEDPDRGSYPGRVTYNIMVRATDPFGSTAEVPVTVIVTDVAESPKIDDPPSGSPVSVMVHGETVEAPMAVVFYENGTGTVADFSAKDPDGDSIAWSVLPATEAVPNLDPSTPTEDDTSVDSDLFEINSLTGVLTFKSPPNYEDKKDGDAGGTDDSRRDDIYQVTVRARSLDTLGGSSEEEGDTNATYRLKVKVLNVPENPVFRISSSSRSREEDHGLEAAVTRGPDRPIGDTPVTAIDPDNTVDDADTLTYTLEGSDAASFAIVPATGQLLTKDVLDYETRSEYSVVVKASDDTETDPAKRDDTIDIGIEVLDVLEIVPAGLTVEGQAEVDYSENGDAPVGEYTAVGDTADNVTWNPVGGEDAAYFRLEGPARGSSSVMLKFRESPNFEMPRGMAMSDTNTNTYNVTVEIGHTSSGTTASLPVQVTVEDAAELGMLTGMIRVSYVENGTVDVDTYMVDGPMAADAMWSLDGDDMDQFMLDTDTGGSVMLMFAEQPNFEMPRGMAMSADNTNTYMVTVKAMVGGEMAMQPVIVMVTDANDDGVVAITPTSRPRAGMELTANLSDDDGGVMDVTWQWSKSRDETFMDGTEMEIGDATSAYTPVEADDGYYLMAKAMYTDAYGSGKYAMATTENSVTTNNPPMFADETATRSVAENTAAGMNVGAPVMATDDDNDTLSYMLSGDDAMYFTIDRMGQIMVGANAMLDHEAAKNTYMVTVTATDPDGATDSIMVTINVTDVDEAVITPDPNAALIARYDAVANGGNGNGMIDKAEVIAAINDYLDAVAGAPSKADVITLINLYLDG